MPMKNDSNCQLNLHHIHNMYGLQSVRITIVNGEDSIHESDLVEW